MLAHFWTKSNATNVSYFKQKTLSLFQTYNCSDLLQMMLYQVGASRYDHRHMILMKVDMFYLACMCFCEVIVIGVIGEM